MSATVYRIWPRSPMNTRWAAGERPSAAHRLSLLGAGPGLTMLVSGWLPGWKRLRPGLQRVGSTPTTRTDTVDLNAEEESATCRFLYYVHVLFLHVWPLL